RVLAGTGWTGGRPTPDGGGVHHRRRTGRTGIATRAGPDLQLQPRTVDGPAAGRWVGAGRVADVARRPGAGGVRAAPRRPCLRRGADLRRGVGWREGPHSGA